MPKQVNPNLAKIHRSYTVDEAARVFGVHKNTVRHWIKAGLSVCDDRRPALILGRELRSFLRDRRQSRRRRCRIDEMYCLRCRAPRRPVGDMVDYVPVSASTGRLIAMCPSCDSMMNRFIRQASLERIRGIFDVSLPTAEGHIGDS